MLSSCLHCNQLFKVSRNTHGKYCCNQCQKDYESNQKYILWLSWDDDTVWLTAKAFKRAVIRRDGYKCSVCSITEWNNKKIDLELEHKDGNFKNNKSKNLCLLCPNCHSQTETYKAKNKGNGREYRRKLLKHCGDAIAL